MKMYQKRRSIDLNGVQKSAFEMRCEQALIVSGELVYGCNCNAIRRLVCYSVFFIMFQLGTVWVAETTNGLHSPSGQERTPAKAKQVKRLKISRDCSPENSGKVKCS